MLCYSSVRESELRARSVKIVIFDTCEKDDSEASVIVTNLHLCQNHFYRTSIEKYYSVNILITESIW